MATQFSWADAAFGQWRRVSITSVVGLPLLLGLTGCGGDETGESRASTPSVRPSPGTGSTVTPFPYSTEPVAVEPGTYRIPPVGVVGRGLHGHDPGGLVGSVRARLPQALGHG
jgi:hypothetical protein